MRLPIQYLKDRTKPKSIKNYLQLVRIADGSRIAQPEFIGLTLDISFFDLHAYQSQIKRVMIERLFDGLRDILAFFLNCLSEILGILTEVVENDNLIFSL